MTEKKSFVRQTIKQFYNNFLDQFSSQKWQITYSNQQNISYFKPALYIFKRGNSLSLRCRTKQYVNLEQKRAFFENRIFKGGAMKNFLRGAQESAFALGAQYTMITIFVRGHYSPQYRNWCMCSSIFTLYSSVS